MKKCFFLVVAVVILNSLINYNLFAQEQAIGAPKLPIRVRGSMYVDSIFYLGKRLSGPNPTREGALVYDSANQKVKLWNGVAYTDLGGVTTETDPIYTASSWFSTTNNSSNWNSAYTFTSGFSIANYYATLDTRYLQLTNFTWSNLSGKPTTFTPSAHTHTTSEVTDLSSYTGFDSRYYTETEIQNFFSGVAAITGYNKTNWDAAFSWGNHASQGYALASSLNNYLKLDGSNSMTGTLNGTSANFSQNSKFGGLVPITMDRGGVTGEFVWADYWANGGMIWRTRSQEPTYEFELQSVGAGTVFSLTQSGNLSLNGLLTSAGASFSQTVSIQNGRYLELAGAYTRIVRSGGLAVENNGFVWTFNDAGDFIAPGAATFSSSVTATNFIGNWQGYTPSSFALASHTHSTSDITNLSSYTGFDSRYYTESEVNSLLSGYVPTSRTLTINGTTYDLSANRSWTVTPSGTFSLYPGVGLELFNGSSNTQNLSGNPTYYLQERLAKETSYQTTSTTTANIATYNPSINEQGVLNVIVSGFDGSTSDKITYIAKVYYYKSASNTVDIYVSPVGNEEYLWGNFSSGFNVDVTTSSGEIIIQANGTGNSCYWTTYTRAYPNYPAN